MFVVVCGVQDIDLKSLVYEAYHKGAQELLYVVPFTAKVLEACAKSLVSHCVQISRPCHKP
jgi:hypothetical protein